MHTKKFQNNGRLKPYNNSALNKWLAECFDCQIHDLYDFGCGYGTWSSKIAKLSNAKHIYVKDIDEKAEKEAKDFLGASEASNEDKFDLIMSFAVLELLSEQQNADILSEFRSKLKSDESSILIMYNFFHILNLRWIIFAILGLGDPKGYHNTHRFERNYLTLKQFERICNAEGLYIKKWFAPRLFQFVPLSSKFLPIPSLYQTIFIHLKAEE